MTTPARKAEMVLEWKAQRLVWIKVRNEATEAIRCCDELIESFGEGERGTSRP